MSLLDVLSFEGVLLQVLAHLGFQSIIALGSCSKRLHASVLRDSHIWRTLFQRAYTPPALNPEDRTSPAQHASFRKCRQYNSSAGNKELSGSTKERGQLQAWGSSARSCKHGDVNVHTHAPDYSVPPNTTHTDFSYIVSSPIARHLSNCATMHALLAKLSFRAVFSLCLPPSMTVAPQPFAVLGGMHALGAAVEMELEDDLGAATRPLDSLTSLPWPIIGDQWRREPQLRRLQMPNSQRNRHATDGLPWLYR